MFKTNIPLLVLAGGFGTRLQTAVSEVPKALAPIANIPFLHYQIAHWLSQGLNSFLFLLHHQSHLIIEFLINQQNDLLKDCQVDWLVEAQPMGTGGAVAYAVEQLNLTDVFLLTNADTWLGNGIKQIFDAPSPAMAVVKVDDAGRYGCVELDDQNTVKAFHEKASNNAAGFINAGLCLFHPELFKDWDHKPFSLEHIFFPAWAKSGILKAVTLNTDFIDIGVPEDYFRFCRWIESDKIIKL
jgi:D-glycero-alpha-D-manno-heptose 1-phosphate guanylyltransferase